MTLAAYVKSLSIAGVCGLDYNYADLPANFVKHGFWVPTGWPELRLKCRGKSLGTSQ
jgi:hypothetical protein